MAKLCATQIGFAQIAAGEVGPGQVALLQIRFGKIGACKIGALASRVAFVEFLVRVQNVL